MNTFWESFLLNLFKTCAIIIATLVAVWWLVVPAEDFVEEEVDPFSVTVTYHCKEVLADSEYFSEYIVSECKRLEKELQNVSKPNKPIV